jgi:hypothetical protein
MRTFGRIILGVVSVLMLLGGLGLIVVSAVLFSWAGEPDPMNFNGVWTEGGLVSLLLGLGFVVAGVVFLRRLDAPPAGGSSAAVALGETDPDASH